MKNDKQSSISKISCYLKDEIWEPTVGKRRFFRAAMKRVVLALNIFLREHMQFRASALTYSLMFALVPILAIVFAIAKGFGLSDFFENQIRITFSAQQEVADTLIGFINQYLSRVQGGIFLGFGVLMLLYTLFSLCSNVESTFNQIWQVPKSRRIGRQLIDYTAVFFLLPIFVVVSSGLSIFLAQFVKTLPDVFFLHTSLLNALRFLPFLLMICFCTCVFALTPNTHVRFRSALLAGIPVGIIVQALMYLYIDSQVLLTSYNAVYGSFAALPLLMLWCQFVWYAILFGATLSYVDQNLIHFYKGRDRVHLSRREYDRRILLVVRAMAQSERTDGKTFTAEDLSGAINTPVPIVADVLRDLERLQIIEAAIPVTANTPQTKYYLVRDVRMLSVSYVLSAIDELGETLEDRVASPDYKEFRNSFFSKKYGECLIADLKEI